jgi:hypothetical protein
MSPLDALLREYVEGIVAKAERQAEEERAQASRQDNKKTPGGSKRQRSREEGGS